MKPIHNESKPSTPEYRSWSSMLRRCSPNSTRLRETRIYRDRNITVCERWKTYQNFLADMGRKPSSSHTIDRIDNDKGYEPSNCRWATKKEQALNRRGNKRYTYNGLCLTLSEWSAQTGTEWHTLKERLNCGWSIERTLTTPVHVSLYEYHGFLFTIPELCELSNKPRALITDRLTQLHWSVHKALTTPVNTKYRNRTCR